MHTSSRYIAPWAILANTVLAATLTTITPCPQDPQHPSPVTVVSQLQTVPTCTPQVQNGVTSYSYTNYLYVSSTVQYKPDGTSQANVLVTDTAQWMTVTQYPAITTTVSAQPEIHEKQGLARFNEIADWPIPGWNGSGLCKECLEVAADGSRRQKIHIQECWKLNVTKSCIEYDEYWYSKPVPPATSTAYPVCATKTAVAAAGTYTFAFPQPAVTSMVKVPGSGEYVVANCPPWTAYVTKTCNGPTNFDFTATVTKTITLYVPYGTDGPTWTYTVQNPPATGFPNPGPPFGVGPGNGNYGPGAPIITAPGQFTTVTVPAGGATPVSTPVTITVVQPSGTLPGTVIVVTPTGTSPGGAAGATITSSTITGSFVSVTVTASGTSAASGTITATLANPTGTAPGTVVVVVPPTTTPCVGALCVGVSATIPGGGAGVSATILPGGSTVCNGVACVGVSVSVPVGGGIGATATVLPGTTTSGASGSAIDAGLQTPSPSPCTGVLCVSVGVSLPGGAGATVTAGAGNGGSGGATTTAANGGGAAATPCTGPLCVSVGVSLPGGVGATVTAGAGNGGSGGATTTPCTGILCVSVGASVPIVGVGATVTAGVGNGANGAVTTTTANGAGAAGAAATPCTGLLCVSVGANVPVIGSGATVTAGVGNGANGAVTTTTANGAGAAATPCTGLLCVSVGANVPVVGSGATVTAGVANILVANPATTPAAATTPANAAGGAVATTPRAAATTPCQGVLCVSAGANVPLVGAGASVSAIVLDRPGVATTTPAQAAAATTPCVGLLCVNARVSLKRAEPTTLVKAVMPRQAQPCSVVLNVCQEQGLSSLFSTQSCTSRFRVGCVLTDTLDTALLTCRGTSCQTYGTTGDGLLGLTTSLSISAIQARVNAYARSNGVCSAVRSIKLYSSSVACLAS